MKLDEVRDLFRWALTWHRNAHNNREFTERELAEAVKHYREGIDPWESAAAICEGRELSASGRVTGKSEPRR